MARCITRANTPNITGPSSICLTSQREPRLPAGRIVQFVAVFVLLMMLTFALEALHGEWLAHDAHLLLDRQEVANEMPELPAWTAADATHISPRVAEYRALAEAHLATSLPRGGRMMHVALARIFISAALAGRPHWGEAWVTASFVALLERGEGAPETLAALARSYREAPFLKESAAWRLRLAVDQWRALDPVTRLHAMDEGRWLAGVSPQSYWLVYDIVIGTPAAAALDQDQAAAARPSSAA